MHKGLGHCLLVPSQYMGGGLRVKPFNGFGMTAHPKEVSMGWDHLMHAVKVGDERELDPKE